MSIGYPEDISLPAIEKKVEEIWTDVLEGAKEQRDATFFELGGESVSATRIVTRIEGELGIWIEVGDIFEDDPTLDDFIRTVAARASVAKL